jgi:hypothetical protein
MKEIVLIADIVSSRKIKDRNKIQKNLEGLFKKINKNSGSILSPMTITLGDEFQCVYSDAGEIFRHIWKILHAGYPEKIRFSYGIGEITTRINRQQAIGMDGPAFYEAREGLFQLKQTDYLFNIRSSNNNSDLVNFIRNSLYFISYHIEGWKKNRVYIMSLLADGMQVRAIAQKLKISEQAVYKNIRNGGLQLILELSKNITGIINNLVKS